MGRTSFGHDSYALVCGPVYDVLSSALDLNKQGIEMQDVKMLHQLITFQYCLRDQSKMAKSRFYW